MIVDRITFFLYQRKIQFIPFNQTEEWIERCGYKEENCVFFIDDIHNPQLACWGVVFNRKFIGKQLIISGESRNQNISISQYRKFYREIIDAGFNIINVSNESFYDVKYEIGLRRAGFYRPLISSLSPLTIILELNEEFKPTKDWRRHIKNANASNLSFAHIEKPTFEDLITFANLFSELKEAKNIQYSISAKSLFKLFSTENYKLFFVNNDKLEKIAGRIVYVNGVHAYDVHAANSNEARESGAAYFIIEEIIKHLKGVGVLIFDYGRISPSATDMDLIYRAKSYSGGTPTLYNGTWAFYKSKFLEFVIVGYNYFIRKYSRY